MLDTTAKIEQHNQSGMVEHYYTSLYSGDLKSVKEIMTEKSYIMVLESFGLKLSLEDPAFRIQLDKIEEDENALKSVEEKLSIDLKSRKKSPQIHIVDFIENGTERHTVDYTEDGKKKKLHFSKEEGDWKINYYAGRPVLAVSESYYASIKKWILSKLS